MRVAKGYHSTCTVSYYWFRLLLEACLKFRSFCTLSSLSCVRFGFDANLYPLDAIIRCEKASLLFFTCSNNFSLLSVTSYVRVNWLAADDCAAWRIFFILHQNVMMRCNAHFWLSHAVIRLMAEIEILIYTLLLFLHLYFPSSHRSHNSAQLCWPITLVSWTLLFKSYSLDPISLLITRC